jgi:cytochrome c-type biogenesis protein CcmH
VIIFSAICALLIVLALAFILPPLRYPDRIAAGRTETQANIVVYRRQLAEITVDLDRGLITDDQFVRDREELEQRLFVDLPTGSQPARKEHRALDSRIFVYALAVGLPVTAIFLYLLLGTPSSFL